MLYPLKFEPVYKNIIWGGRNIEKKFNRPLPDGKIGESWDMCCCSDGMSIVSNGHLKGTSLQHLLDMYKEKLLGTISFSRHHNLFPLLVKIIDANDKLSVQVHPDDFYAKKNGQENGKTEMWYIIDAKPGARLIHGIKKGTTRSEFMKAIQENNMEIFLKEVPVKPGDVIYIPAGTVHAILDGILIAEIQQNSTTTYRLYDWNRVDSNGNPRELHIDKALDVIDFNGEESCQTLVSHEYKGYTIKELCTNEYFSVEEIVVKNSYMDAVDGSTFHAYMFIDGEGFIKWDNVSEDVKSGQTVFIPASLGHYEISGNIKALRIHI